MATQTEAATKRFNRVASPRMIATEMTRMKRCTGATTAVDPSGLYLACVHEAMTKFLATLAGKSSQEAADLGRFAGDGPGGADSFKHSATNPINIFKSLFKKGPSSRVHFASNKTLEKEKGRFDQYMASGNLQKAGFVLHAIEDVRGAHKGFSLPLGHGLKGPKPDRIIGDAKFFDAANEVYQLLSGNKNASLTAQQREDLINAIVSGCVEKAKDLLITETVPTFVTGGGGGLGGVAGGWFGGGYPSWWYSMQDFLRWVNSITTETMDSAHVTVTACVGSDCAN